MAITRTGMGNCGRISAYQITGTVQYRDLDNLRLRIKAGGLSVEKIGVLPQPVAVKYVKQKVF